MAENVEECWSRKEIHFSVYYSQKSKMKIKAHVQRYQIKYVLVTDSFWEIKACTSSLHEIEKSWSFNPETWVGAVANFSGWHANFSNLAPFTLLSDYHIHNKQFAFQPEKSFKVYKVNAVVLQSKSSEVY